VTVVVIVGRHAHQVIIARQITHLWREQVIQLLVILQDIAPFEIEVHWSALIAANQLTILTRVVTFPQAKIPAKLNESQATDQPYLSKLTCQGQVVVDVFIDINAVVLAGEDNGAVVHQAHVEALCVLDLGLESVDERAVLAEHSQVEVVVVVGD